MLFFTLQKNANSYYSFSLLQHFVEREEYKDAQAIVEEYTKQVYLPLLEEMDLMAANEWLKLEEYQPSESTSILEVKLDAKIFLLKKKRIF